MSDNANLSALQQVQARHLRQVALSQRASRPHPLCTHLLSCEPPHASSHTSPSRVAGMCPIRVWLAARNALGRGAAPGTRGTAGSCLQPAPIAHPFVYRHATKEEILSFRNASKASEAPYQCRPRLPISTRPQLSDCQPSRVSLHIPSPRRYRGCNGDENCRL